ncbi:anthranilate synthase component I [Saccharopolyspora sp. MS10]|uniref:anthranilate synthase component I n=1 Tax=Saccharopolyspora sp. MS10 TaxID=3385973 RepID=UPI0039A36658
MDFAWIARALEDGAESASRYRTAGGLDVERHARPLPGPDAASKSLSRVAAALDSAPGALFHGAVTQPGRYAPWTRATDRVALAFEARGRAFRVLALDPGAGPLLELAATALAADPQVRRLTRLPDGSGLHGAVARAETGFTEEERTRQPSTVGVLRTLTRALAHPDEPVLGWYGAFGYDLMLGFDPIPRQHRRPAGYRDLVAFLPATVIVADPERELAVQVDYTFSSPDGTSGPVATAEFTGARRASDAPAPTDPGHYRAGVRAALSKFHAGDAFETVLSQTLTADRNGERASVIFERLAAANPSPYGFLINLGRGESLVGASPEMYVRVTDDLVETCPISGTIARGASAIEDSRNVATLLASEKEAAELTMCTDVDRNDKSRVAVPGSVRIVGRRQIELYSRLIHTVDHVQGQLEHGYDAWDAFLSHMWAATVSGAPKRAAAEFIERWETSARRWYGGAVGYATVDGAMDTALTLRTARLTDETTEVRAGATLLIGSDPEAEEAETRLKASAVLGALRSEPVQPVLAGAPGTSNGGALAAARGPRVTLVDHEDSFVHTLAGYLRQNGCEVVTRRWSSLTGFGEGTDLVVLSPGPDRPAAFRMSDTIDAALAAGAGVFGVCLGMQGIVEHFGGRLRVLPDPIHGRASRIRAVDGGGALLRGLPDRFTAGRYHSLYVTPREVPPPLRVTAVTDDGVVMAVEHPVLPIAAVQFHPESLLSLDGDVGHRVIANLIDSCGAGSVGGDRRIAAEQARPA